LILLISTRATYTRGHQTFHGKRPQPLLQTDSRAAEK